MGQQLKKIAKRIRRKAYLERCNAKDKAAAAAAATKQNYSLTQLNPCAVVLPLRLHNGC